MWLLFTPYSRLGCTETWPYMTTWGDIQDLPKWPGLIYVSPKKRVARFNTLAGRVFVDICLAPLYSFRYKGNSQTNRKCVIR